MPVGVGKGVQHSASLGGALAEVARKHGRIHRVAQIVQAESHILKVDKERVRADAQIQEVLQRVELKRLGAQLFGRGAGQAPNAHITASSQDALDHYPQGRVVRHQDIDLRGIFACLQLIDLAVERGPLGLGAPIGLEEGEAFALECFHGAMVVPRPGAIHIPDEAPRQQPCRPSQALSQYRRCNRQTRYS